MLGRALAITVTSEFEETPMEHGTTFRLTRFSHGAG